MGSLNVLTFAIDEADIALYGTGAAVSEWTNIPIVSESSLELASTEAPVTDGEGNISYIWYHSQRCTAVLKAKQLAFRILELISGNGISSIGTAERLVFGTPEELTPPPVRLKLRCHARDMTNEANSHFEVVLYKCSMRYTPPAFAETTASALTFNVTALKATKNDSGATLPGKGAFGHMQGMVA
jgi:hypothetical protein